MAEPTMEQLVRDHESLLRGAYGQPGLVERMAEQERVAERQDRTQNARKAVETALRWTITLLIPACTAIIIAVLRS